MTTPATVTNRILADENNAVCTIEGGGFRYRRTPCAECPWRVANAGSFPAEAFRISTPTSYDGAMTTFACHMNGSEKPAVCAGFLLRNSVHNIGVRLAAMRGAYDPRQVSEDGAELFESYREMAIENGVDSQEACLRQCRGDDE